MKISYYMNVINSLALTCLLLMSGLISAQAPNWSVNPSRFQYSMTVTAVLDLNCTELLSPSNQLGAFVGDSLRGSAFTSNVIGGRYEASMTIYSDSVNGEQVSFRYYRQSSNTTVISIDTIAFQDNAIFGNPANPLPIRNNVQPSMIALSSDSLQENQPSGTTIGTLSTTDIDAGQTHIYALVSGMGSTDNSSFSIAGSNLIANFSADFENKSSYSIRLRTTDNLGCTYEQAFTIIVKDVNDAPTGVLLSNNQIDENQPNNSTIGNLSAIDTDANETFTYSLVAGAGGADNGSFNLNGNVLRANAAFNFENQALYSVRVQVADKANNVYVDTFKVIVNNVNDVPTDIVIITDSVIENAATNTIITSLTTTDEDISQTHTYSFNNVAGNDNALFNIIGNSLRTRSVFDFEIQNLYFIYVQTNDGNGGTYTKQISINIKNGNDSPSDINLSTNSVSENMAVGSFVAKLFSTDQDANSTFNYSLVNGIGDADNGNFSVRNDTLFTASVLSLNAQTSQTIRIETNDGNNGIFTKSFTLTVKDINDIPSDMQISNTTIAENIPFGSEIATLTTTDSDAGDIHTYSFVSGVGDDDNMSFSITNDKVNTNTTFNINVQDTFKIRLQTDDGFGGTYQEAFILTLTNSNDAPTDIRLSNDSIFESLPPNTSIGNLSTLDPDTADTHTYSFISGTNNNASFAIVGNELRSAATFNFEVKSNYFIFIRSSDGNGESFDKQFNISIKDSNDVPTAIAISVDSLLEKSPVGSYVADLNTTDADATDSFTYSLVAGQGARDNALFRINGNLLEVDSVLNFSNGSTRNVRIESSDKGGQTIQRSFVIRIIDQNDFPTDILLSDTTINEIAPIGTRVATITTTDEDLTDTFTYSLIAGSGDAGNSSFAIVGDELQSNTTFDYESQPNYTVRIRTTDSQGGSFEKTFNIALTNGNEKPSIDPQFFSISENSTPNTIIGTVTASDMDANETFTFSILGRQLDFRIDDASGALSSSRTFDYKNDKSFNIEVEVTDAGGLKDTATISIEILDQIEASLPSASYFSPNGDGRNDDWRIQNVELYSDFSLKIFSVNGELVYEKMNNYNNDWRGTFKGTQLPEGIYYYYFENTTNPSQNFKGVITLKR